jgi:hypothetical protein
MDVKTKLLIAVGATVVANCQSCLEEVIGESLTSGAEEQEIVEAIAIGKMVRNHSQSKMDRFAPTLFEDPESLARADEDLEVFVREYGRGR